MIDDPGPWNHLPARMNVPPGTQPQLNQILDVPEWNFENSSQQVVSVHPFDPDGPGTEKAWSVEFVDPAIPRSRVVRLGMAVVIAYDSDWNIKGSGGRTVSLGTRRTLKWSVHERPIYAEVDPRLDAAPVARSKPLTKTAASAAIAVAGAASRIAGPYHPWTSEVWRADLEVGPYGDGRSMSVAGKLRYSFGLLIFTAPRYRLAGIACSAKHLARTFWTRTLFSNRAIGLLTGAAIAWLARAIWADSGLTGTATFLSTAIPATAWGIRWLRKQHGLPEPQDDE